MAAVIPEAAGAVTEGTAAVRGASSASRARTGTPGARAGAAPRGDRARQRARRAGGRAARARLPGAHTYQPVILAEFLTAIVIVSVSPVAKGGTAESVAKGSPSPYSVNTLKQLVAIGGAYFILALLAASRRAGRYAAWFGALILLGLGFAELANGDLTALFKVFGPHSGTAPSSALGTGGIVSPGTAQDIGQAAANALPTLEPGGTLVPSLIDSGVINQAGATQSDITVPAGQSGVITTGSPPGVNLA